MQTPDFYNHIPTLRVRDPLAHFLGASQDGVIEYSYLDVVKLAGHSCPTVAASYWMTRQALLALYGDSLPERGAIQVEFRDDSLSGVTGVMANVVSMLTGATVDTGFKGLAGRFDRRRLLAFKAEIPLEIRFTRKDTGEAVDVAANPRQVPADPEMMTLMQHCLTGAGDEQEQRRFGDLWQVRVARLLLDYSEDDSVFTIRRVETPKTP